MSFKHYAFSLFVLAGVSVLASQPVRAEETAKKEAPAQTQAVDDDTQKRLAETLSKMGEMDKQWGSDRGKSVKNGEMTKEDKKRVEERKKAEEKAAKERKKAEEKGSKTTYRSIDSGTSGHYSSGSSSGWVETGGVTHSSSYSSSGGGGSVRESSYGGTSIGARATVIRLE